MIIKVLKNLFILWIVYNQSSHNYKTEKIF